MIGKIVNIGYKYTDAKAEIRLNKYGVIAWISLAYEYYVDVEIMGRRYRIKGSDRVSRTSNEEIKNFAEEDLQRFKSDIEQDLQRINDIIEKLKEFGVEPLIEVRVGEGAEEIAEQSQEQVESQEFQQEQVSESAWEIEESEI